MPFGRRGEFTYAGGVVGRAVYGLLLVVALVAGTTARARTEHERGDRAAHLDANKSSRPVATRLSPAGPTIRRAPRVAADGLLVPTYTWAPPARRLTFVETPAPLPPGPAVPPRASRARGPPAPGRLAS